LLDLNHDLTHWFKSINPASDWISERCHQWSMSPALYKTSWAMQQWSEC